MLHDGTSGHSEPPRGIFRSLTRLMKKDKAVENDASEPGPLLRSHSFGLPAKSKQRPASALYTASEGLNGSAMKPKSGGVDGNRARPASAAPGAKAASRGEASDLSDLSSKSADEPPHASGRWHLFRKNAQPSTADGIVQPAAAQHNASSPHISPQGAQHKPGGL